MSQRRGAHGGGRRSARGDCGVYACQCQVCELPYYTPSSVPRSADFCDLAAGHFLPQSPCKFQIEAFLFLFYSFSSFMFPTDSPVPAAIKKKKQNRSPPAFKAKIKSKPPHARHPPPPPSYCSSSHAPLKFSFVVGGRSVLREPLTVFSLNCPTVFPRITREIFSRFF